MLWDDDKSRIRTGLVVVVHRIFVFIVTTEWEQVWCVHIQHTTNPSSRRRTKTDSFYMWEEKRCHTDEAEEMQPVVEAGLEETNVEPGDISSLRSFYL